jgi:hypothetical protein
VPLPNPSHGPLLSDAAVCVEHAREETILTAMPGQPRELQDGTAFVREIVSTTAFVVSRFTACEIDKLSNAKSTGSELAVLRQAAKTGVAHRSSAQTTCNPARQASF